MVRFWEDGADKSRLLFWLYIFGVLLQWKNTHVLNFTYNAMDDVVACLLYYTVVILYMTSSTPERFRRSWFWGVTDWYQSIVYSELSISTNKRYTNL